MPTQLAITHAGAMARIRFVSRDGLQILSRPTLEALREAIDHLSQLPALRLLVLEGSGERAFSAGADLRELALLDHETALAYAEFGQGVAQAIARFPVPTVAALQAPVYGGGIELALACDFRLAAPGVHFHYQAARLGLLPGWGGTQRLPRLVGPSRAKAMMLTCQVVTAEQALAWGLLDEVGPIEPMLTAWADELGAMERHALVQIKRAIELSSSGDYQGEREAFAACFADDRTPERILGWLARSEASRPPA